jgi:AraC-like DNA-binding protein
MLPVEQRFFADLLSGVVLNPAQLKRCWFARPHASAPAGSYSVAYPRLEIVLRGEYSNLLEPQQKAIAQGEMLFIPGAGVNQPGWQKDVLLLGIVFAPAWMSLTFHDKRGAQPGFVRMRKFDMPHFTRSELGHILQALGSLASRPDDQAIIQPLCLSLLHVCREILTAPASVKQPRGAFLYQSICTWLEDNYARELTRENTAAFFNITGNHLSRLFHQQGSRGFVDYLRWVRMGKAKIILQKYNLTVQEVARRCGYPDGDYFSRLFKREFGVTPGEYRDRFLLSYEV